MCVAAPIALGIASLVVGVAGTVMSVSAQQSAAEQNARAQAQIAQANAESARQIAEMNALSELRTAELNANSLAATAAAEAQIAETNARRIDVSAQAAEDAGRAEEERRRTRSMFILADQRARYGASGVLIEGSPLEVLAFSAGQEELDALTVRFNTDVKAGDLRAQAASTRLEGALGVQDAATRSRNLLSDAITRGETGIYAARVQGAAGLTEAQLRGAAGVTNASNASMGTLASGFGSALGSASFSRAADALWGGSSGNKGSITSSAKSTAWG